MIIREDSRISINPFGQPPNELTPKFDFKNMMHRGVMRFTTFDKPHAMNFSLLKPSPK